MRRPRKSTRSRLALATATACIVAALGAIAGPAAAGVAHPAPGRSAGADRSPRTAKETVGLRVQVVRARQILATGKVRPVPARGTIVLQLRRAGAWRKLGRSPLIGHGAFRVRAVVPLGATSARADPATAGNTIEPTRADLATADSTRADLATADSTRADLATADSTRADLANAGGATAGVRLRAALYVDHRRVAVSKVLTVRLEVPSPSPKPGPPPATGSPSGSQPGTPGGGSSAEDVPCTPPQTTEAPAATPAGPLAAGSLMATIDAYAGQPNHLSGTPASAAAEGQFTGGLAAAGLNVCEQAFTYPRFTPTSVALTVGATTIEPAAIAPLLYSGATPPGGISKQLFYAGVGENAEVGFSEAEVKDKIVVAEIKYEHNSKAIGLYPAIEAAVEDGAAGFVAVTQAVGNYPKWEDTNARRGTGRLPTLMVGKESGAAVITAAKNHENAVLTLAVEDTGVACDRDVWGELEGADPSRRVFVGVPVSSYTPSASEHGTGLAIVVGLARHYAELPKSERPETLVFIGLGGHEIGWLGLQALLASPHGNWFREGDAYVHLGSALGAPEAKEEPEGSGTIKTLETPDKTGRLHDSENPFLVRGVEEDFEAAGIKTAETPPFQASGGEQTNAFAAGIPTASFSGASLYFHTAGDTPSTINQSILTRQADAFRRVVDLITAIPAGQLRAANGEAAQHGAELESSGKAAKRAPANPALGAVREAPLAPNALAEGGVGGPAATPVAGCP